MVLTTSRGSSAHPAPGMARATRAVVRCGFMPRQILGITAPVVGAMLAFAPPAGALTVYAAHSLTKVVPPVDRGATYAFGGSNALQLQIERGAPADLFLAAEPI